MGSSFGAMQQEFVNKSLIIIVDDDEATTELLELTLRSAGYTNYRSSNDPRRVLALCSKLQPDLVILDLQMPHLDGSTILGQLRCRMSTQSYFPILILTADVDNKVRQSLLQMGAMDFLNKPFERTEFIFRVRNLLETHFLY